MDNVPYEEEICPAYHDISHTPGFMSDIRQPSNLLTCDLTRIHLQLGAIFTLTNALHFFLFRHLLLPRIVSEIMAGIILGPSILGRISSFHAALFPVTDDTFLIILSRMGFILYIFLWGVKMDPRMILKAGWREWTLGVSAYLLPLTTGSILKKHLQTSAHPYKWKIMGYVVSTHCYVSFPMVASILVHLKIINSELGHLALSSSFITNILTFMTSVVAFAIEQNGMIGLVKYCFPYIGFILYLVFMMRPLSYWIIRQTPGSELVKSEFIMMVTALVLGTIMLGDEVGVNHENGAFLVGLLGIPGGPPLGSSLVLKLETVTDGLLAPLLASRCGIKVNLLQLYDLKFIGTIWILVGGSLVIKVVSFLLPALLLKVPPRDSLTFAFVLSSEGIVQIVYHLLLLRLEVYDGEIFSMMVLSVLLFAATMDALAKVTYDYSSFTYIGYKKRTVEHEGATGELIILPCMHRVEDVFPVTKLLEVSMPDEDNPVSISVVNMVELVGRATPQIIDHKFGEKEMFSGVTHSQEMLDIFVAFEQKYTSLVQIHFFSAISSWKFMHQDICSLAFKQCTSLIILPFHRKWNQQGKVILDNYNLRDVNCNVLDVAPCSVGVLMERQKMQYPYSSSYNVGVIFIGGPDDIEALSYGKRMARSPGVHLTVVYLVEPQTSSFEHQRDKTFDVEALRDLVEGSEYGDDVVFRHEVVKDGSESAWIVHKLKEACDLIMVGRRHEDDIPQLSGLAEWNEFPEIGQIGDIIATSEIHKPLSVLVVQQQTMKYP